MRRPPRIAVVGGGVSGLTTGLVLRLLGYPTTIFTAHRPGRVPPEAGGAGRPAPLASLHAAASVLPHSVPEGVGNEIFEASGRVFALLAVSPGTGVRIQRHCELFEAPRPLPAYASAMRAFEELPATGEGLDGVPRRPGARAVFGWRFEAFFAEMPRYLPWLAALYGLAGGALVERRLDRGALARLDTDLVVDCSGVWSGRLFGDPGAAGKEVVLRGHWVKVLGTPPSEDLGRPWASYNYHPAPAVYPSGHKDPATGERLPADLYFYPRVDGWVLGGSRQRADPALLEAWRSGRGDAAPPWQGEETEGPSVELADGRGGIVRLPEPIVALNRQLILEMTGVDVGHHTLVAAVGWRFLRTDGPGLELDAGSGLPFPAIRNTGHGGGGVTLSWGCALRVAAEVARAFGSAPVSGEDLEGALDARLQALLAGSPPAPPIPPPAA